MYGTCLTGIVRAEASFVGKSMGAIIVNGAVLAAAYFLEGGAQVAMILIAVALTAWWYRKVTNELAKHEEVKRIHAENEKLLKNRDLPVFGARPYGFSQLDQRH